MSNKINDLICIHKDGDLINLDLLKQDNIWARASLTMNEARQLALRLLIITETNNAPYPEAKR